MILALSRAGSLSEAAAELGIDPSNVGRRLAALDERIGARLFERGPAGVAPTELVRSLVAEAGAMEAAALAAERKLAASFGAVDGRVRIASSEAFAMYFLFGELGAVRDELPGVEVEPVIGHSVASLANREADVALRFVRPTQQGLYGRRVGAVRWSVYGAPAYLRGRPRPDPEAGFAGHRVIRWGGAALRPAVTGWVESHARSAQTVAVLGQLHHHVEACAGGLGLAALPGVMALGRGGMQRVIDHAIDETDLWLVVHRDLRKVPRVRAVADALAARIEAAGARLRAI